MHVFIWYLLILFISGSCGGRLDLMRDDILPYNSEQEQGGTEDDIIADNNPNDPSPPPPLVPPPPAYSAKGELDTSFNAAGTPPNGGPGVFIHDGAARGGAGGGEDAGQAVSIDGDGKIIVAGRSPIATGDDDLALWRFE